MLAFVVLAAVAGQAQPAPAEPDPVICRREAPTGSRVSSSKTCRKKAEWKALADKENAAADRLLEGNRQRTLSNPL